MHYRFLIFMLLVLSPVINTKASDFPAPVEGVLDLRDFTFEDNTAFRLNGEWEFYWQKLLKPENFKDSSSPSPDAVGTIPSYWSSFSTEEQTWKQSPH